MAQQEPIAVVIVAFEGSVEMSITIARDMFCAANMTRQKRQTQRPKMTGSDVYVVTQDGDPVTTFSGATLVPDMSITACPDPDLVIVSGVWRKFAGFLASHRRVVDWLRDQYERGITIASMHSGTFLLAEAGLLDNRVATVYWQMEDEFRARYPDVILQPERKITSAGHLYCSAGISSGLEMAVHLIERIYGIGCAERVAESFLMDIPCQSAEFQLVFDAFKRHQDRQVLSAQQWLESNFSSDFLMDEVADKVGLSHRSFMRRFKKATGDTPLAYLQHVRIETAKELLRNSAHSVEEVGYRVGYTDPSYFSRLFKRRVALTPGEYRVQQRMPASG
jgi:transcriptional regulator GlxA family with amidase domain